MTWLKCLWCFKLILTKDSFWYGELHVYIKLLTLLKFKYPGFETTGTGVQLLGSTAKNIAESCEISPYVTLKEKSTSP